MRKYEIMFIVKTTMEASEALELANTYKKLITDDSGEVTNFKEMGQRKLAYPIKKQLNGFYYLINFNATTETIKELDRKLKLDENIIRHMIIKLDEE